MNRSGFEAATTATKRPQTYALDRAATGIGSEAVYLKVFHVATRLIYIYLFIYIYSPVSNVSAQQIMQPSSYII
jgi:hypothetical protein